MGPKLAGPTYAERGVGQRSSAGGAASDPSSHAAASSRIENYPGFPSGLSGHDLSQRAALQAFKFGAELSSPCQVTALDATATHLRVDLAGGTGISSRAVLIATGARYRVLPLPRWAEFEGAGIYYAATELEARACGTGPVTVVGGANSAGQAALYLAARGNPVTLAIRGADPAAGMSAYLLDRLHAHLGGTVVSPRRSAAWPAQRHWKRSPLRTPPPASISPAGACSASSAPTSRPGGCMT